MYYTFTIHCLYNYYACTINWLYITVQLHLLYIAFTLIWHLPYMHYTSTVHLLYIYYTFTMHLLYINCAFTIHLLCNCYAFTTGGDGDSGMDLHPTNMKWHGIPCHKRQWGSTPTVRAPKARAERGGGGARPVVIWRWGRNALAPSSTNLILTSAQWIWFFWYLVPEARPG